MTIVDEPIRRTRKQLWLLTLGALGVVYGDIGTSPLYTLRECMAEVVEQTGQPPTSGDVLDVLSLIFWSLTMVVTVKYIFFIMRANNRGEGGIFALLALLPERMRSPSGSVSFATVLVIIGASFLYGDGAITPAISVLSAIEGLAVARPELDALVIPMTVAVLLALFAFQRRGTGLIGKVFGPIVCVWFITIALLGLAQIIREPLVLQALSPHHAASFFVHHGARGIGILGAVVLAITGGEALYADMGHFGLPPIRRAWFWFVLPSLLLCYFGQGALILRDPAAIANPFFHLVPQGPATVCLVIISTLATIIASQALISGAFSLTRQAMQLGLFPRVTITHTAREHEGQIYIPEVNTALAIACVVLVLTFGESSRLASAYGIAVTCTMMITSIVFAILVRSSRGWSRWRAGALLLLFLSFDVPFVIANLAKIGDGGWVPILMGSVICAVMLTWRRGRGLVREIYSTLYPSFEDAWSGIEGRIVARTPGSAVFLASTDVGLPPILVHHVEHTRALAETVVLLTLVTRELPVVENKDRLDVTELGHGFVRVHAYYGFMEQPHVPKALRLAVARRILDIDLDGTTYYLARERILTRVPRGEMNGMQTRFFAFLTRNAVNADRYFRIPHAQVIELGAQIDL